MTTVHLELDDELMALLHGLNQPVSAAVRELVVLELYRRALLSSGKAAELLGLSRWDFVRHAGRLGIPYFALSDDEWSRERAASEKL